MSRSNKVNPDHYTIAGRLSPDDLARERAKQADTRHDGGLRRRGTKSTPPWLAHAGHAVAGRHKTVAPAESATESEAIQPAPERKRAAAAKAKAHQPSKPKPTRRIAAKRPAPSTRAGTSRARGASASAAKARKKAAPSRRGKPGVSAARKRR
jgi:hypothetical protein